MLTEKQTIQKKIATISILAVSHFPKSRSISEKHPVQKFKSEIFFD